MRIVAGHLRGRKLASVRGMQIRPTADRIRESLFNILGQRPAGAAVLDLFAGTGALGIEALSRDARTAVFVENGTQALVALRKNIGLCRIEERSRVIQWNIRKNLNCLKAYPRYFDLIFMDPPYGQGLIQPTLNHLLRIETLAPHALVVVEHDPAEIIRLPDAVMAGVDNRRYGRTQLSFFEYSGASQLTDNY